jgi:hypothetical protein
MGQSLSTHQARRGLLQASGNGDLKSISLKLKQGSEVLLESAARRKRTAWHSAAKNGQLEALLLLEDIVRKEMSSNSLWNTYGYVSVTEALLSLVDASDKQGVTPLMLASQRGHAGCVRYLLSKVCLELLWLVV